MEFVEFVKRQHRDLHDGCDRAALQRLGRALERAGGLTPLVTGDDPALEPFPAETLVGLAEAQRRYAIWKETAMSVRRELSKSALAIPDGSLDIAFTPHELAALTRAARMCQRSSFNDHDSWAAGVKAHVELWVACVETAVAKGSIAVSLTRPDHPDSAEFESALTSKAMLAEVRGYRWLAARRGERAGVLSVALHVPWDAISEMSSARLHLLGLAAERRGVKSVLDELAANDIEATLRKIMDERAEYEALRSTRSTYRGLLLSPPVQAEKLISAFVGASAAPAGYAVLDKGGEILEHGEIALGDDLKAIISAAVVRQAPAAIVLPASAPDRDRLRLLEESAGTLPTERVNPAAVSEARQKLSFPPSVGAAVVLGRRALRPAREWGRVNPVSLGLGEYPRDMNPERLASALAETKALASWERRSRKAPKKSASLPRPAAVLPSARRMNPLIKSVRDLKPGMTIEGVITNLTKFGAFVNIGLATEAMVHVSQLSHEFVEDPSQIVRVGQVVSARVIEVVPEKSRIALTMKPLQERPPRDSGIPPGERPAGSERSGEKKHRSAALANLDALFKK
ncbi:MAG: S1 RNA-binding domain-containing protein [Deltaproteobacteria bacterium]|nr:S1 RNA-binding domain-containing protein [Deltaproteobacteria bacterium]